MAKWKNNLQGRKPVLLYIKSTAKWDATDKVAV